MTRRPRGPIRPLTERSRVIRIGRRILTRELRETVSHAAPQWCRARMRRNVTLRRLGGPHPLIDCLTAERVWGLIDFLYRPEAP